MDNVDGRTERLEGASAGPAIDEKPRRSSTWSTLFARLLIGLVVLICAEVFSGASLKLGLWHPWTLIVTYWLYFAHFFLLTTLAVRTGRTSPSSLYLWGVLFGLYESWITKVIWSGYSGDGKLVMGSIGPYGYSEISMVFLFHPVMSFIIPLAVACLICPPLRSLFPGLAWLTGRGKWARVVQIYLLVSFAPIMAMNSGGPINLALNVAVALVALCLLWRLGRPALMETDGRDVIVFHRGGFIGLCAYLVLLYGVTYVYLRPECLPSRQVQLITFVYYAFAIVGLWYHGRRAAESEPLPSVQKRELRFVWKWFAVLLIVAVLLTPLAGTPVLYVPIVLNFAVWTPLGLALSLIAYFTGRSRQAVAPP